MHLTYDLPRKGVAARLIDAGDGAAVSNEECLTITGKQKADVLIFDLA